MPTIAQQPIDVQWIVGLVSATTVYSSPTVGLAAAIALSAGNGNAVVQGATVDRIVTSGAAQTQYQLPNVQMPTIGFVTQLQSAQTYYPLNAAIAAAYALSAGNLNAPVYVSRVFVTLTAP